MPLFKISFLYALFFLSGAAGLLYQVMWMKELSLLFGSSTQSAAVTTAAFFLGLALGARLIGNWLDKSAKAKGKHQSAYLGYYALLEIAIAISALLYFLIYPLFNGIYGAAFDWLHDFAPGLLLMKLILAMVLLSVPAFFMGGTLPVMAELVVDSKANFGKGVAGIYFINTLGACTGALAGGFWLPKAFGFTATYFIAIGISVVLAVLTWTYYQGVKGTAESSSEANSKSSPAGTHCNRTRLNIPRDLIIISAWSGFAALALQVLWTRLFSQVLQNSTYTYSAILTVFLLALALGAVLARTLAHYVNSRKALAVILLLSGLLVALTPSVYMQLTNQMSYVGGRTDFTGYIVEVVGLIALAIGPAIVCMGVCLPYLYKLLEKDVGHHFAYAVGQINSVNTFAAIAGSLLAGFVLFRWLGTWQAIYSIALLYMLAAVFLLSKHPVSSRGFLALATTAVVIILLNPGKLPVVPIDPIKKKERLLEVWEGSTGTVAVVDRDGNLKTKLNNWYALGGSKAKRTESMQTHLPVNIHGKAKSVFYLGLGTGITAGTILDYPVEKVVVAELVREVITASEQFFAEFNNDLFNDPRVTIVNEDGRHYLQASRETFDLIIADLFIPWRSGVGSLYALEHFQNAKQRLNQDGFFVQWLPLYQMSETEFSVITKTMNEVFPLVTVWRGDFYANKPIVAVIGHQSAGLLKDQVFFRQASQTILKGYQEHGQIPLVSHYVGRVRGDLPFLNDVDMNTDDKPVIEYLAPETHRAEKNGQVEWLTGTSLLHIMKQLHDQQDPYLEGLTVEEIRASMAGYYFHASRIAKQLKDQEGEQLATEQFNQLMAF